MLKCPFCHFENEEGALFCEQCKSDLGSVAPVVAAPEAVMAPVAEATPAVGAADDMPMAAVIEATPVLAEASVIAVAEAVAEIAPAMPPPEPVTLGVEGLAAPQPSVAEPASAPSAAPGGLIPPGAQVRLLVLRGLKRNVEYPIYDGLNFIGRADEKPVDIDLEDQEPPDRIWSSRQHAVVNLENGTLTIEDLNSSNGSFVNRQRIYPGQKQPLNVNDVIQIGTVQLKVII
jgi:hypothetical protein